LGIIQGDSEKAEAIVKLDTDFAGMCFKEFQTDITWRRTMNYAAAVLDHNPLYFDDEREGGVIAPPMFAVAPSRKKSSPPRSI
jgi:hypothetical protein